MSIVTELLDILALGGATVPMVLIKATVVVGLVWLASFALRHAAASTRHLMWLVGVIGLVLLPLTARIPLPSVAVLPSVTQADNPSNASLAGATAHDDARSTTTPGTNRLVNPEPAAHAPAGTGSTVQLSLGPTSSSTAGVPPAAAAAARPSMLDHPTTLLFWLWLAVATAVIAWLLAGVFAVRRIVRGARVLASSDWTTPMHEIADRLDLAELPRLVMSDHVELAFVCDLWHPTVVLPPSAESWSPDQRRAVLLHELAHVRRRDLLSHALGRLACALYWFHPLVWGAARRLRAESERACDDIVLSCGARASDYAQQLLTMVTNARNDGAPGVALAMARRKEIEGRMLAILDPALPRLAVSRARSVALVGPLALLVFSVGAVAPARRAAEISTQTASVPAPSAAAGAAANVTTSSTPQQLPVAPSLSSTAMDTAASQPKVVRDRTLGPPTDVGDEAFDDITAVRELSDGRLMVIQMGPPGPAFTNMMAQLGVPGSLSGRGGPDTSPAAAAKVVLFDAKLSNGTPVGRTGAEPTEFQNPMWLFAAPRDTTLIINFMGPALMVVDPKGAVVGTRSIDGGVTVSAQIGSGSATIDRAGRLVYEGASAPQMQTRPEGMLVSTPDSVGIVAYDFNKRSTTTLAYVHVAGTAMTMSGMPGQPGTVMHSKVRPFPTIDDWVMMPNGTMAIIRGADLRIDWIDTKGKRRSTPPLPYVRVPVTEADRAKFLASQRARAADTMMQRISKVIEDDPDSFPAFKPPFTARSAKAAPDGTIWLPSKILSPSAPAGYDVIDDKGRLVERVHLAAGQKLLGFGKGVIYVSFRDSVKVVRVGRVSLR